MINRYLKDLPSLTVPEIRKLGRKIVKEATEKDALILAAQLLKKSDRHSKRLGIHILAFSKNRTGIQLKKAIIDFAASNDWELREEGASTLRYLIVEDFAKWFLVLKEFVQAKNVNLNRAAVVGSMAAKVTQTQATQIATEIYEPLLSSKERYIMVNLGPFALGLFLIGRFPQIGFNFLDKWLKIDNEYVRWNVIMTFSQSAGKRYPKEAAKYIKALVADKRVMVQRAIKAVIRKLDVKINL